MGDRLTLRTSRVWPMVGLIVGASFIFLVAFVALHAVIRSYVGPSKSAAASRLELALAGSAAGLATSSAVIPAANAAAAPPDPAERPDPPRGVWAMATPPTWLATVDAAAGLGVPTAVDAPVADTLAPPAVAGLAAASALAIPPPMLAVQPAAIRVPLPRPRPPQSSR